MSTTADERIQSALGHLRENLDVNDIADLLEQVAMLASRRDQRKALTAEQEDLLTSVGMPPVVMPQLTDQASTMTWRSLTRLIAEAYSTAEVAAMLSVGASRIRQHVSRRTLLAIKAGGGLRFPRFQFASNGSIISGWEIVAPHFPADVHPVAVESFLIRVSEELEINDQLVSPLIWLVSGGDPQVIAQLVEDAYRVA